jgi:hypothetical protein
VKLLCDKIREYELVGWELDEARLNLLFQDFRKANSKIWKYASRYPWDSPEHKRISARYYSQLNRWLKK